MERNVNSRNSITGAVIVFWLEKVATTRPAHQPEDKILVKKAVSFLVYCDDSVGVNYFLFSSVGIYRRYELLGVCCL